MKSCLVVCLIILLVFVLLLGGLVFAVRPPYKVISAQPGGVPEVEIQSALKDYMLGRVEAALDDYPGEGDLTVALDEASLGQVLADALGSQIKGLPSGIKYKGIYLDIKDNRLELGGAFKLLVFSVGVSARLQIQVKDNNLELKLLSTRLGRIPLPVNFVLRVAGRFSPLPAELETMSVTAPLDLQDKVFEGVYLSGLKLEPEHIFINLRLEEGLIPEIPDSAVKDLAETIPVLQSKLEKNHVAIETLGEIQNLLDQTESNDKKVNPLTLLRLSEELYDSLSDEEMQELNKYLDDDVKAFLEQAQEGHN